MRAADLVAKSAVPDNKSYQEWHFLGNVIGYDVLRISAQSIAYL